MASSITIRGEDFGKKNMKKIKLILKYDSKITIKSIGERKREGNKNDIKKGFYLKK